MHHTAFRSANPLEALDFGFGFLYVKKPEAERKRLHDLKRYQFLVEIGRSQIFLGGFIAFCVG
jgi:hypothetical protein